MPIRHEIRGALLWIVVDGGYDEAELERAKQNALHDPAFRPGMPVLIDSRKTSVAPSRGGVAERAAFLAGLRPRVGPRCALVVSDPLHYGLARMLAAFGEPQGLEIQVFQDPEHAEAWLLGP